MTSDPQKTVFISYRRSTSKYLARLIFKTLHEAGYDVFLDVNTLDSGAFDAIILRQIAARAHFIVLLTPGSLERCQNEEDWLRLEIEEAMQLERNVIPIIEEGFDFQHETEYLPDHLRDPFRRYNGLPLVHFYFDAVMEKLINRFLKQPIAHVKLGSFPSKKTTQTTNLLAELKISSAPTVDELTAEQLLTRAYQKEEQGDIEDAIEDYSEALQLNPQYIEAYNYRGIARVSIQDYVGAAMDFSEVIALNPNDPNAYYNRAIVYKDRGDLERAHEDYSEAIQLNPNDALFYAERGGLRQRLGDFAGAFSDFTAVIELNPEDETAYYSRGVINQSTGHIVEAIEDYTKAIVLNPQNASAYTRRGRAYLSKRDLENAIADFSDVVRLRSQDSEAYQDRALTHYLSNNLHAALVDYSTAIRLNPDYMPNYHLRGLIHYFKGDYISSINDLQFYLQRGGGEEYGDQADVEARIRDLKRLLNL